MIVTGNNIEVKKMKINNHGIHYVLQTYKDNSLIEKFATGEYTVKCPECNGISEIVKKMWGDCVSKDVCVEYIEYKVR